MTRMTLVKRPVRRSLRKKTRVMVRRKRENAEGGVARYRNRITDRLVSYFPLGHKLPLPPTYRTKMHAEFYGYDATGVSSMRAGFYMNRMFNPFSTGALQFPNPSQTMATLTPYGFENLVNADGYQYYRVYKCKAEFEVVPQALTDTVNVSLTASNDNGRPIDSSDAMGRPFSVSKFNSSSKQNGPNGSKITLTVPVSKFLGVSAQSIKDDISFQYTGDWQNAIGPQRLIYIIACADTPDGVVTVQNLEYYLRVTWYVELFGLQYDNLIG